MNFTMNHECSFNLNPDLLLFLFFRAPPHPPFPDWLMLKFLSLLVYHVFFYHIFLLHLSLLNQRHRSKRPSVYLSLHLIPGGWVIWAYFEIYFGDQLIGCKRKETVGYVIFTSNSIFSSLSWESHRARWTLD
jgi:hypothetical protein